MNIVDDRQKCNRSCETQTEATIKGVVKGIRKNPLCTQMTHDPRNVNHTDN